ncbi:MAG: YqaJ viral recombinase family protein [Candidatus Heimdallarchaeota archaeon]|nr:YqaJ viral recombinase family protein [Candidatus Heimdallarchaeota archaeon]
MKTYPDIIQRSPEWYDIRRGKIGGTGMSKVMGSKWKDFIFDLIAQNVSPWFEEDPYLSEDMQRGIELEPEAREAYEKETGNKVTEYGYVQHESIELLGMSPDGFTQNNTIGIEIKCPRVKGHLMNIFNNSIPASDKWQIVSYFLMGATEVHYVSYCPDFERKPLHIIKVESVDMIDEIGKASIKLGEFQLTYNQIFDKLCM